VKDVNTSLFCLDEKFSRNKGNMTITLSKNTGAVPTIKMSRYNQHCVTIRRDVLWAPQYKNVLVFEV